MSPSRTPMQDYIPHISTAASRPCKSSSLKVVYRTQPGNAMNDENFFTLKARENAWESMVRSRDEAARLPQIIECMCIHCQEEGKIGSKRLAFAIDNQPRWTKESPVRYIERTADCWTCETERRMVPVGSKHSISNNESNGSLLE